MITTYGDILNKLIQAVVCTGITYEGEYKIENYRMQHYYIRIYITVSIKKEKCYN